MDFCGEKSQHRTHWGLHYHLQRGPQYIFRFDASSPYAFYREIYSTDYYDSWYHIEDRRTQDELDTDAYSVVSRWFHTMDYETIVYPLLRQRLSKLTAGGQTVLSLTTGNGATKDLTLAVDRSGPNFTTELLESDYFIWTPLSAKPNIEPSGVSLTIYDMGRSVSLGFDATLPYACYRENGVDYWYEIESRREGIEYAFIASAYDVVRSSFDHEEYKITRVTSFLSDSADPAQAVETWGTLWADALRSLTPDSRYAVQDAALYGFKIVSSEESEGFTIFATMALQLEHPFASYYWLGDGFKTITEGPYTGWWQSHDKYQFTWNGSRWSVKGQDTYFQYD